MIITLVLLRIKNFLKDLNQQTKFIISSQEYSERVVQVESGEVKPGQKIVAISGSPKAISGLTSTARLYKVSKEGEIVGTE